MSISGYRFLEHLNEAVSKNKMIQHALMVNSNIAGKHDTVLLNDMEALSKLIRDAIDGEYIEVE